ncbi:methyltransferase [Hydrocarboniphaga sp.]|uniref:methyltransferase n=1 Tax=Hydrocarboniphaga sp. TaxID=2033016 RepID=UPI003D0DBE40
MQHNDALLKLLQLLKRREYRFVTTTPLTHARVLARDHLRQGHDASRALNEVFGWNREFVADALDEELRATMHDAGLMLQQQRAGAYRSALRVSSLGDALLLHSAYPTLAADSVFFGPDTYRFAQFVAAHLPAARPGLRCADIGCGSGAGAIAAASLLPGSDWLLTDINPRALALAAINAAHAGFAMQTLLSDVLAGADSDFDLLICNPPYLADDQQRAYRDGGADLGRALSLRIAREACERLAPDGRLLLYTGVAIVDGVDPFLLELRALLDAHDCRWSYRELDPDVFGEELERPVYAQTDRIAAIGLVVERDA